MRLTLSALSLVLGLQACGANHADGRESTRSAGPTGPAAGSMPVAGGSAGPNASGLPMQPQIVPVQPGAPSGPANRPDAGDGACVDVRAEAQAQLLPSDIVWAIDTSGSMIGSFPAIQAALASLSTRIVSAGIDAHIVLLAGSGLCVPAPLGSGTCADPFSGAFPVFPGLFDPSVPPPQTPDTKLPSFLHLDLPFSSQMGMGVLLDNYVHYKHLLRPNARLQLVLTEDGAPPMTSAAVIDHIEGRSAATTTSAWDPPARPGNYVWSGVLCEQGRGAGNCRMASGTPTTTLDLIKRTNGILAGLDRAGASGDDPFAELLTALAEAVIVSAAVSCEYAIPPAPAGETFDRNKVNVTYSGSQHIETTIARVDAADRCKDVSAWHYDNATAPTKVTLCPRACEAVQVEKGAKVRVGFGCETVRGPE